MEKIVKVNVESPRYGETELNVGRVIALIPSKKRILFEDVYWDLSEEDFKKVYEAWKSDDLRLSTLERTGKNWKPSEEQMKALSSKLPVVKGGGDKVQNILETLYNDLKAL